jgi:hypothetical protein
MGLDVFAILFALALLMAIAFRGLPVIFVPTNCCQFANRIQRAAPYSLASGRAVSWG